MAAEIDEQSLRLCIRLQGQDAIALIKGKKREDEQPPDVEFAAELYKFELQSLQTFYYDRALCRRLHRLDLENGDPLGSRAGKEKPAPKKPDNEVALAQPSRRSTSDTGVIVSIVDEETTKQSNDEVASTRSTTSSTSGTSISAKNVEETTEQSDDEVVSARSSISPTSDTNAKVKIVEETTKPGATP